MTCTNPVLDVRYDDDCYAILLLLELEERNKCLPSFSPTPLGLLAKAADPPSVTLLIDTPSAVVFPRDLSMVTPIPSPPKRTNPSRELRFYLGGF